MPQIKIDVIKATRDLTKALDQLSEKKVQLSIYRSLNSAIGKTQTQGIRFITTRYNLKREQVANRFYVQKASPSNPYNAYLKVNNTPFSLSQFNPRQISNGVATGRFGTSKSFASKKVKGLRANKSLIKSGVIVQVIRGTDKVIDSAFLSFRQGKSTPSTSARGRYNGGFKFNEDESNRSLRGVGVGSALRSNEITPKLRDYASQQYVDILYKELQKRVKSVGETHVR